MAAKFAIGEAIGFGWEIVKKRFWFLLGLLALVALVHIGTELISSVVEYYSPLATIVLGLVFFVVTTVVHLGVLKISLLLVDDKPAAYGELFKYFNLFIRYAVASFLYALIVICGFILLIVPGIIWAIRFQFFGFFIVDKETKIIDSLKKSAHITHGAKWTLFVFEMALILLNIVGFFCLLVGLLVTIPVSMIAYAYVYRKLQVLAEA